jgi:hypothetical protein
VDVLLYSDSQTVDAISFDATSGSFFVAEAGEPKIVYTLGLDGRVRSSFVPVWDYARFTGAYFSAARGSLYLLTGAEAEVGEQTYLVEYDVQTGDEKGWLRLTAGAPQVPYVDEM